LERWRKKMIGGKTLLDSKEKLIWACLIFLLGFSTFSLAQESAWFCRPYGTVEYRGDLASDGLEVKAFIEEQEFASCLTSIICLFPKTTQLPPKKRDGQRGILSVLK
jgi:hypothetical protein